MTKTSIKILVNAIIDSKKIDKLPSKCGVHWAGNHGDLPELIKLTGRSFIPHRIPVENGFKLKLFENGPDFFSTGNEMERENGYSVSQIFTHIVKNPGNYSPALTTLKAYPEWRSLFCIDENIENFLFGWCLNTHGPSIGQDINIFTKADRYYSWLKRIDHLVEFSKMTNKNIIITESGCGQTSDLTEKDVRFQYSIHNQIFGDRMKAFLVYDSAIIKYNGAHKAL